MQGLDAGRRVAKYESGSAQAWSANDRARWRWKGREHRPVVRAAPYRYMTNARHCSGLEVGRERQGAIEGSCTEECALSDAGSGEGREMSKPADGNGECVRIWRERESERRRAGGTASFVAVDECFCFA